MLISLLPARRPTAVDTVCTESLYLSLRELIKSIGSEIAHKRKKPIGTLRAVERIGETLRASERIR